MTNHNKKEVDTNLRQFIKNLGYVAGGTALLGTMPWLKSCTPEMARAIGNEKARIGLIGTGSRGLFHIHSLLAMPHAEIVALCDNHAPNLQEALDLAPWARTYTDYRELLEANDIDGVIISTPLYQHAQQTLDSLDAGKHVFCEKAMAHTMEDCKTVYEAYQKTDKVLYYCLQRMFDEKYIKGMGLIHSGTIGEVVGTRCHWFRNHDWRRPVPSPELERHINWRLYWDYSGGLITELASHQIEVSNWAVQRTPSSICGMGDIVFWKDGREVYDSISLVYRYNNGVKMTYESLISNRFNGMEDQILGHKGTMNIASGLYYYEDINRNQSGIEQLLSQVGDRVFQAIPAAGASWRPETRDTFRPHFILGHGNFSVTGGASMVGAERDGSEEILASFCQACITGEPADKLVEECYTATTLCLLGNEAIAKQTTINFPEEYKIPHMKF
jgi:predicted dehydrogenase